MPGSVLRLLDHGRPVAFTYDDMMRYHGPGSPGGVAHAFKVLERALPLLSTDGPPERRAISVRTAFAGPGARDGFELVLRAVTEMRFVVDAALARPERGRALERFVFVLACGDQQFALALREGLVSDEFIDLARAEDRSADQERRLTRLKYEMADRVMASDAVDVYDVE